MPHCFKADASDGFHVERAPNKALASAQSVHSIAAPEDTLLGSHSCPFCLEVMPVNALWVYFFFFLLKKSRIVKSPQVRSDPCNDGNTAVEDIYAREEKL